MARRFLILLGAFAAMVVGIEGVKRLAAWWQGAPLALLDGVLIVCLPLIFWLWWRFASPFAKGRGQCLIPREAAKDDDRSAQANRG